MTIIIGHQLESFQSQKFNNRVCFHRQV